MTMAGQILGIERFIYTHSNRVLAQFIYQQLRPKGRIFIGEPVLVQRHFVGNHLVPAHRVHSGRFREWRTASWNGVSTWLIRVLKNILRHNTGHQHTHRILSLSVGVPRMVVAGGCQQRQCQAWVDVDEGNSTVNACPGARTWLQSLHSQTQSNDGL